MPSDNPYLTSKVLDWLRVRGYRKAPTTVPQPGPRYNAWLAIATAATENAFPMDSYREAVQKIRAWHDQRVMENGGTFADPETLKKEDSHVGVCFQCGEPLDDYGTCNFCGPVTPNRTGLPYYVIE
jgi:hypothetical protein